MASNKEDDGKESAAIHGQEIVSHKPPSSNGDATLTLENEKESRQHLTEDEQRILDRQLDTPTVKVSYFMLYRYATKTDLAIVAVASVCAITAGVVLPLMTVRLLTSAALTNPY